MKNPTNDPEPKVELWIKRYHHRLELIRTVVPLCLLFLQIIIAAKLFNIHLSVDCIVRAFQIF